MLSQVSLDVYRFAVSRPGWTAEDASEALGYTSRSIDAAIAELTSRCLLLAQAADCPSYTAVSPDVALAELVDPDERALLELRGRINSRRREMAALTPAYVEARKRLAADSSVEVVEDQDKVQRVLIEYGRSATDRVLIARPGQGANADIHEESVQKDLDLLRSGVQRQTLYHSSTRDHVPTRKAVETITAAGGQFRTLPYMPLRTLIFDEKVAVVARQLHPGDVAGLVIRDPNLIRIFGLLFEFAWGLAEPFLTENPARDELTSTQRSVLTALAAGYSDEAIARRVGISVRTCRRHIAWMLEELGAESRFQAGIKAHKAGWI
ncbi:MULTISPECIES: helix-turn-helix transcriptional regulator [unclassified Arthrobacter]|uniref:helix-turn-helix transcriptional regulator n=1 Tax=unclassified Arthrobacter TaxID=235627 RepID=UPI001D15B033|nr:MULTISPECIES: helix-turn-helix transcriptional regulator [unclassified Arthrobacter]MCC9176915.1 helix-turn-helix transcriptional regulator [Arthrobacter sp. zg-Y750]MCC3275474.1 helix-turn-helix transcriptional regulator [Arthrobacter sp. zg-Y20]MDK1315631.1 helix-turn-helix transcriptional regulator [Arthrobacter sp. zg.Y20]MDK1326377.1 helix-turn-helix transcriptional regulator [Arthrobacter sp. zg-Y1143]WIB06044.1 helix-turn-helix transcriptional regulator [Arthrobacter sp. zg-Y20]